MTPTPTPRREPRTAAGRTWHATSHRSSAPDPCPVLDMILAIEAEARALALSELEEAIGGLPGFDVHGPQSLSVYGDGRLVDVAAVIQLIRDKQSEEER